MPEMTQVNLRDDFGRQVIFTGAKIGESATHRRDRWTEFALYAHAEGGYVYHRIGRSRVYHRDGSACARGKPVHASSLSTDNVPCVSCRPGYVPALKLLGEGAGYVDLEEDFYHLARLLTAEGVIEALTLMEDGKPTLSHPARRLLESAAQNDKAIRKLTTDAVIEI